MAETEGWFQFSDKTSTTTNFWVKVPDCSEDMFVPCDNFTLNRHLCAYNRFRRMMQNGWIRGWNFLGTKTAAIMGVKLLFDIPIYYVFITQLLLHVPVAFK